MHAAPALVDCTFTINAASPTGITGLTGPLVAAVYSASNSPSALNPNPINGYIVVQLQDSWNRLFGFLATVTNYPAFGSPITIDSGGLTPGTTYVISTVGNATLAQWHAIGLAKGVTPAVGVGLVALTTGPGPSTTTSAVDTVRSSESTYGLVGDSNLSIAPNPAANQGFGAQFFVRNSDETTIEDGTQISLMFYLSNSSIKTQGE